MWSSASRESASRHLTALRRAAARVRARDLAIVLGRVAAVLFCLQLFYLAAANLLLRSQLIQKAVSSSKGMRLEFDRAYSLWLGHVHVHDLSLRFEDYNVQFEVALAEADVDIAISELPFKKFRVTHLDATGTRFRMRHKLIALGDDRERVAAFPPIKGFADPPYFVGLPEPRASDENYSLWQVRIDDVAVKVSELWIMEYRFQGAAMARGSFSVKPQRRVQVQPASLDMARGTLKLGSHLVAQDMRGRVECEMPGMDVRKTEGIQIFRELLASVRLKLTGGQLQFLQAYLARLGTVRYGGNAEWSLDAKVVRGVVQPRSRIQVLATPLTLRRELDSLSGDVMINLERADDAPKLALAVSAPSLVAVRSQTRAPSPLIEGLAGSLETEGADFTRALPLGAVKIAIERASVPSLTWFASPGMDLSGSAEGSFEVSRSAARSVSGAVRVNVNGGKLERPELGASGSMKAQLTFSREPDATAIELGRALLQLSEASLRSGKKRSEPFAASLDGAGLRLELGGPPSASGMLRLHVSSAEALLPLVMGDPFQGLTSTALDLKGLDARASIEVKRGNLDLKVVDARSGNLRLRGYLSKRTKQPRGAFLLSSGPLNVGVTLTGGETEVSPFVGDDWLAVTWPTVAPGPG